MKTLNLEKIKNFLKGKKHIRAAYIIVIIGVVLLVMPSFSGKEEVKGEAEAEAVLISAKEVEEMLSAIKGVGKCRVLITYKSGGEYETAKDISKSESGTDEKNIVIGSGSGEHPFVVKKHSPEVLGAVVVCEGGGSLKVKSAVVEAVSVLCGVAANRVKVFEK